MPYPDCRTQAFYTVKGYLLMVELSCTPSAEHDADRFRFALLAPEDFEETEGESQQ